MVYIKFVAFSAPVVFFEKIIFAREKFWATDVLAGIYTLIV